MNQSVHIRLISFIGPIADDCLRDVYVLDKYRDDILPLLVFCRVDLLYEPMKGSVEEESDGLILDILKMSFIWK